MREAPPFFNSSRRNLLKAILKLAIVFCCFFFFHFEMAMRTQNISIFHSTTLFCMHLHAATKHETPSKRNHRSHVFSVFYLFIRAMNGPTINLSALGVSANTSICKLSCNGYLNLLTASASLPNAADTSLHANL